MCKKCPIFTQCVKKCMNDICCAKYRVQSDLKIRALCVCICSVTINPQKITRQISENMTEGRRYLAKKNDDVRYLSGTSVPLIFRVKEEQDMRLLMVKNEKNILG